MKRLLLIVEDMARNALACEKEGEQTEHHDR